MIEGSYVLDRHQESLPQALAWMIWLRDGSWWPAWQRETLCQLHFHLEQAVVNLLRP